MFKSFFPRIFFYIWWRRYLKNRCSNLYNLFRRNELYQHHGDRFLLQDSGLGDPSRMIIFATDEDLEMLSSSDHLFGDGTFEVSPFIFFQLYTIYAIHNGGLIPCAFALLPNKRQVTYDRLFGEIMQHMQGHIPMDFQMNSDAIAFIGVIIKGCFYLSRNLWKKSQDNGLKQLYENDQGFSTFIRMIASVAFVPILDGPQTFCDAEAANRCNFHQNGYDVVLDYFEDTYIGRQRRGRPRNIPMFPMEIWNMYDCWSTTENKQSRRRVAQAISDYMWLRAPKHMEVY